MGRKGRQAGQSNGFSFGLLLGALVSGVGPAQIQSVLGASQKEGAKLNSRSKGRSMGLNVREPGFLPSSAKESHWIGVLALRSAT